MDKLKLNNTEIEQDDIFFISAKSITSWIVLNNDNAYELLAADGSGELEFDVPKDLLFVVKYKGNGIIEEMNTGKELLVSTNPISDYNELEKYSDYYSFYDRRKYLELSKEAGTSEYSMEEYIEKVEEFKEHINKYPLIFNDENNSYRLDDNSKKMYLGYSNEVRMFYFNKILKDAKKQLSVINDKFDLVLKDKEVNDEMIDIANLDNQIYDFERREKAR